MPKKTRTYLTTFFGLALFGGAVWVLFHELRVYHLTDILRSLTAIPKTWLLAALILTVADYLVLTGYDQLAFKYIHHPLPYRKIALTSFIGYAFSHNIGLTFLTGGSVRYRFYSAWGLSALEIAKVVIFCGLTYWLGFCLLGGFAFWLPVPVIPDRFALPFHSLKWLGWILLAAAGAYLLLCSRKHRSLTIRRVEFSLPGRGIAITQMALSTLDWLLAAGVFFSLLPRAENLNFPVFLAIFLLAQTAGLVSQVPAGLGVFETVILLWLEAYYPGSVVLGILLAFRAIYYLLPLGAAVLLLGIHEAWTRQDTIWKQVRKGNPPG